MSTAAETVEYWQGKVDFWTNQLAYWGEKVIALAGWKDYSTRAKRKAGKKAWKSAQKSVNQASKELKRASSKLQRAMTAAEKTARQPEKTARWEEVGETLQETSEDAAGAFSDFAAMWMDAKTGGALDGLAGEEDALDKWKDKAYDFLGLSTDEEGKLTMPVKHELSPGVVIGAGLLAAGAFWYMMGKKR